MEVSQYRENQSNCFSGSIHTQDILRVIPKQAVMHFKGLIFGLIFSAPFWAFAAYCYWWVR